MKCLKCSRETSEGQVFCDECLAQMKKQPIKPGTPVNLPQRPASTPRSEKHAVVRPEDQIVRLEARVAQLRRTVTVLALTVILLGGILMFWLIQSNGIPDIGQNYTPMTPTSAVADPLLPEALK